MPNEPLEKKEFKRGHGGRPTPEEAERRHTVLLQTAMRLFLERGLDSVSTDEISKEAGVAKRFIYARYRGKDELFLSAVEYSFANQLDKLHAFEPSLREVELGLAELGRQLVEIALRPDALALHRLFISAAPRFPDLTRQFAERSRDRNLSEIRMVLTFYAEAGKIETSDPQMLAEQFFIAIVGIPQRLALLGLREPFAHEQHRLTEAVRLFLRGCRRT